MQYLKIDSTCQWFVVHEIFKFNVLAIISILGLISNLTFLKRIPLKAIHVLSIWKNASHITINLLRDMCISSFIRFVEIIDYRFH